MAMAKNARAVDRVLEEKEALSAIIGCLRVILQEELCRRECQDILARLATVSKKWHKAVNKHLYRNPFFGNAERGLKLRECLQLQPSNAQLVTKLIFGEGSDLDIKDWKDPSVLPDLVGACTNLRILGLGGMGHEHINHVFEAMMRAKDLHELRACDRMPAPLDNVEYFYNEVMTHMKALRRLRLYGLLSMEERSDMITLDSIKASPNYKPAHMALTDAAFNYCAMSLSSLQPLLAGSAQTLTSLSFEGPYDITHQDLVMLLSEVGSNLKVLEIEGFPYEGNSKALSDRASSSDSSTGTLTAATSDASVGVVDAVLRACPKLRRLDFIEGVASEKIFDGIDLANLQEFRFTCAVSVRPSHWLDALHRQYFRKGARGRIESIGWKASEIRHVRIAAWQTGVSWLSDGG